LACTAAGDFFVDPWRRGNWWRMVNPLTVVADLTAAQRGGGKRASLYTDYTFRVWDGGRRVPVAKAYAGLNRSASHKSDVAVRFPRILRWRADKPAVEADTLDTVKSLLPGKSPAERAAPF
jgi:DNA ligase-1